jgi:hypothetical protein
VCFADLRKLRGERFVGLERAPALGDLLALRFGKNEHDAAEENDDGDDQHRVSATVRAAQRGEGQRPSLQAAPGL